MDLRPFTLFTALLTLSALPSAAEAAQRLVPQDHPTLQAAVDAAEDGDQILLDDGFYVEKVVVDGKNVQVFGDLATVILAPEKTTGAIITVQNGGTLGLYDVIVDGAARGTPEGFLGIHVKGGQATLENVNLQGLSVPECPTCQTGLGILVEPDGEAMSALTLTGSVLKGYQKGGLVARGEGTVIHVEDSSFLGRPSQVVAQNGIQVSQGASGVIRDSYIRDHRYTGDSRYGGIGILLNRAEDLEISHNISQGNQAGLYNMTPDPEWVRRVRISQENGDDHPVVAPLPPGTVRVVNNLYLDR